MCCYTGQPSKVKGPRIITWFIFGFVYLIAFDLPTSTVKSPGCYMFCVVFSTVLMPPVSSNKPCHCCCHSSAFLYHSYSQCHVGSVVWRVQFPAMTLPGYFWDRWPYFAGKLYWDITATQVNSALHPSGVAKSSTSFGWGKHEKVTAVRWQVTLYDPIWHVISHSCEMILIRNCYIQFTLPLYIPTLASWGHL